MLQYLAGVIDHACDHVVQSIESCIHGPCMSLQYEVYLLDYRYCALQEVFDTLHVKLCSRALLK